MVITQLMGVVNTTPDSYYNKSRVITPEDAIARALQFVEEGATIIDIGGESTRPDGSPTPLKEERRRVLPVIQQLSQQLPPSIQLSIDTYKPQLAAEAVAAGATLINDVTGCRNPQMRQLIVQSGVKVCVMHMAHTPGSHNPPPNYKGGAATAISQWLAQQAEQLIQEGASKEQIIVDPGCGGGSFGKSIADNLSILQDIQQFKALGFPVLLGLSRKSFIQKILAKPPAETLAGTLTLNVLAAQAGVDILRVHDVEAHLDMLRLLKAMQPAIAKRRETGK